MSGPQCCENPPALNPVSGSGHVEKLGGLDAYLSGSPDSKLCVILISDVFGKQIILVLLCSDLKVKRRGPSLYGSKTMALFDKGFEDTKPVIEALKSKGITAIGAAGMCWGAKVVVELSKQELVQAAVLLHPSFVTVDDIKGGKVPIAILGAEIDQLSPPALLKQFEEILASKPEVNSYVKIHPKVAHGWTVRYKTDDPDAVKAAEEAHKEMLDWKSRDNKSSSLVAVDEYSETVKNKIQALVRVIKVARAYREDNVPSLIQEGLYLGSVAAACNKNLLKSYNVTHILTVASSLIPAHPDDFVYKVVRGMTIYIYIYIYLKEDTNLEMYFDECFDFIDEAKKLGGSVLVHCFVGKSRSVTIIVAYLMKKHGMTLTQALLHVKSIRPVASPNAGFIKQLQDLEKSLQGNNAFSVFLN
ncbi:hypothetical protein Bca4012_084265 [Brassica carinata]